MIACVQHLSLVRVITALAWSGCQWIGVSVRSIIQAIWGQKWKTGKPTNSKEIMIIWFFPLIRSPNYIFFTYLLPHIIMYPWNINVLTMPISMFSSSEIKRKLVYLPKQKRELVSKLKGYIIMSTPEHSWSWGDDYLYLSKTLIEVLKP